MLKKNGKCSATGGRIYRLCTLVYIILLTTVKQYLYGKNGPNHMSDEIGQYRATRPIQTLLGQYKRNSADTTRPITKMLSASFPTHTNMADVF